MKIREEIKNRRYKKYIIKINETKSCFFESINKVNKPLPKFIKKRERTHTHTFKMKEKRIPTFRENNTEDD